MGWIEDARERCSKASSGKWKFLPFKYIKETQLAEGDSKTYDFQIFAPAGPIFLGKYVTSLKDPDFNQGRDNAEFIAHARTDLPRALREITVLMEVIQDIALALDDNYKASNVAAVELMVLKALLRLARKSKESSLEYSDEQDD